MGGLSRRKKHEFVLMDDGWDSDEGSFPKREQMGAKAQRPG